MSIICQQTGTISGSNSILCNKLLRIYDIRTGQSTIDVLIEGQISPQVGDNSFTISNQRFRLILISKNVAAGTADIQLTISTIEIPPPPVDIPTHMVQLELAPNPNISKIQQNIIGISTKVAEYIPYDPNVKYIRTELDSSKRYMNVYLKWTGPVQMSSMYDYGYGVYSLGIMDDIKNFIKVYLIPAIIAAIGVLLALAILTSVSVLTLPVILAAAIVAASSFVTAWIVHDLTVQQIVDKDVINNQDAYIQAIAARDSMKKAADDIFAKSAKTNDDCVTLVTAYKVADETYLSTLEKLLPKMEFSIAKASYKGISDTVISDLKAKGISCAEAVFRITTAENSLYDNTNNEFGKNYSPDAPYAEKCPEDCFICEPITKKCIVSNNTAWTIGIGIAGLIYLSTREKSIVIKGG